MKLVKTTSTSWLGNGMGSSSAEWAVKGSEHIAIRQLGTRWSAIDTTKPSGTGRIVSAGTRSELLSKLEAILLGGI